MARKKHLRLAAALAGALTVALALVRTGRFRTEQDDSGGAERVENVDDEALVASGTVVERADRSSEPSPAPPAQAGTVEVLDLYSRQPVAAMELRFVRDDRAEHVAVTGDDGRAEVPSGAWRIESSGHHRTLADAVDVAPDDVVVLWAGRIVDLEVRVLTQERWPVPDAVVSWRRHDPLREGEMLAADTVRTDANGVARFPGWLECSGVLGAVAEGHAAVERALQGPVSGPLVLLVQPSVDFETMCVTDGTGVPLAGALIRSRRGASEPSDAQGVLRWPTWIGRDDDVVAQRDGYVPSRAFAGSGPCVRLRRAARLRVAVSGAAPGAPVFVDLLAVDAEDRDLVLPRTTSAPSGSVELEAPRGVLLRVLAADATGMQGEAELEIALDREEATVAIELAPAPLTVRCESESGEPLTASLRVRHLDEAVLTLTAAPEAGIPRPGEVGSVRVTAAGHESVQLRPVRGAGTVEGRVRVPLRRASPVVLALRGVEDGAPVRGMSIGMSSRDSGFDQYPELQGAWPTDHAGWALSRLVWSRGLAGAGGEWRTALPHGEYRIDVGLPPEYVRPGAPWSLYSLESRVVTFEGQARIVLEVPEPTFVAFDVFEETTGLPVDHVQVAAMDGQPEPAHPGHHWEGWVERGTTSLTVVAPGVGTTVVELPLADGTVHVRPENAARIVIANAPAELRGARVGVQVLVPSGGWHFFASTEALLADDGVAQLFLPYQQELGFGLADHGPFSFRPEVVEWEPGATFVFEAVRK